MQNFTIRSIGSEIVITIDRSLMPIESLNYLFERLRVEELVRKADFSDELENIGAEITENWWRQYGSQYLQGVTDANRA